MSDIIVKASRRLLLRLRAIIVIKKAILPTIISS